MQGRMTLMFISNSCVSMHAVLKVQNSYWQHMFYFFKLISKRDAKAFFLLPLFPEGH